jgi:hypothetical protein
MNAKIDLIFVDYDLFLNAGLLYKMKFHLIDEYLIKYRVHSKQFSHQKIKQSLDQIDSVKEHVLSKLDSATKTQYLQELRIYQKNKPVSKKIMETGLKLIKNYLPESTTDKLLVFYLNKIRRGR